MSEDTLQEQLHHLVTQAEPPLGLSSREIARYGERVRRRRRVLATGATAVVLVAALLVGAVASDLFDQRSDVPITDRRDAFSADELVTSINDRVSETQATATGGAWSVDSVMAEDERARSLDGAERDSASRWKATFSSGEHFLDVILIYEGDASPDGIQRDCDSMLAAGFADTCEADRSSSGVPLRIVERAATRNTDGWPVVQKPKEGDREPTWYLHQVVARHLDGLSVYVTEVVRASSLTEASQEWTVTEEQLIGIATDDELWFPDPATSGARARPGCGPRTVGNTDLVPVDCLSKEDLAELSPEVRRTTELQMSDHAGEISILVEGVVDESHLMLRRCRGLPELRNSPFGDDPPKIHPLICNALELMAAGAIPTGHHYSEDELKQLNR